MHLSYDALGWIILAACLLAAVIEMVAMPPFGDTSPKTGWHLLNMMALALLGLGVYSWVSFGPPMPTAILITAAYVVYAGFVFFHYVPRAFRKITDRNYVEA